MNQKLIIKSTTKTEISETIEEQMINANRETS